MKIYLFGVILCLTLSIILGLIVIPILKKIKVGQPIYEYVNTHKDKNGTPTMGGLFFILPCSFIFLFLKGENALMAVVAMTIGVAFMTVGFIDDFIKIKYKKNQGLKAYQKIIFQISIAIVAGVFAYKNSLTIFHIPFFNGDVNLGFWTIPIVAIIFIAMTNSVNLTDGLDGLASNVSVVYLVAISLLIYIQITTKNSIYLINAEYENLILLSCCLIGGLMGFLLFNTSKASVFMGDTGSLSLGGFLAAISIFSSNSFFIPIVGFAFVFSSISVILQVIHYKRTKKRIFLMAPFHHHLQLKGLSESKISYIYVVVTAVLGIISIIFSL